MRTTERLILFAGGMAEGIAATLLVQGINALTGNRPEASSTLGAATIAAVTGGITTGVGATRPVLGTNDVIPDEPNAGSDFTAIAA
ncbi:hypothetical protein IT072_20600 (plasmid) [Leifsonia sp. ZF2019]|uniref:hypothetical protein n=1 Tax=Leifsonia sp. ZF2019 TaxID=2781978 RepID=UPI001CC0B0AB|nr:hypothetical protein [Leifsonia sp. ZF2019]UAJ81755.1 hypothetical protein IT072_20600 [Leifsonia sp. ZF2019]